MAARGWIGAAAAASALVLLSGSASAASLPAIAAQPVTASPQVTPSATAPLPLRVKDPAAYRVEKAAAQSRYESYEAQRGTAATSLLSPRTLLFSGLNRPGLDGARECCTPPDSTGAIGPNAYLEFVNAKIAVYSRETLESPPIEAAGESTFVGSSDSTCDGQIQWDQEGQRWLYASLDCAAAEGNEKLYFGWSKTPTPTLAPGDWCRWVLGSGNSLQDYPKLGHDDTQVMIGTNVFDDTGGAFPYTGSRIFVFNKPAPGDSSCPGSLTLNQLSAAFTPVPANVADASSTGYVVAEPDASEPYGHLVVYEIGRNGLGENALLGTTTVTVPSFYTPANVPQPGAPHPLDSSDTRLTQAVAVTDPATGKEGIWTQHTIANSLGGPAFVRWYELTPAVTTPRQSGTVNGPSGTFAFDAAISPTANGENAVVFYNSGDATHLVDLRAQDRHASTPLGTTVEDTQLSRSIAADEDFSCAMLGYCRWGDYAGASPDPSNPAVVWGTGELTTLDRSASEDPQWGTRNVAIDAAPVLPPLASSSAPSGLGETAATLNGSVNPQGHDTTYRFEYGTTAAYGSSTPSVDVGAGQAGQGVSVSLGGLTPGTTFHYRLVATNAVGTATSGDQTFATASPPPPPTTNTTTTTTTPTTTSTPTTPTAKKKCKKGFVLKHNRCVRKRRKKHV